MPNNNGQRQKSTTRQLNALGINFEFVYGFAPCDPIIKQKYSKLLNALAMKRALSDGEKAVSMGHRKIWQRILDSDLDFALIFEDDFQIVNPASFLDSIFRALPLLSSVDMIKLFDFQKRDPLYTIPVGFYSVCIYERPNSGLVGYLVTRVFCERLLSQRYIYRPIDEELRYWFSHRVRIASFSSNLVIDNSASLDGSFLSIDRDIVRGKRNVIRSIYANFITLYTNLRSYYWSKHVVRGFSQIRE